MLGTQLFCTSITSSSVTGGRNLVRGSFIGDLLVGEELEDVKRNDVVHHC